MNKADEMKKVNDQPLIILPEYSPNAPATETKMPPPKIIDKR